MANNIIGTVIKGALRGLVKPLFGPPLPYGFQRFWLRLMTASSLLPKNTDIKVCSLNGISAERVTNKAIPPQHQQTVILYLHGGAFCICSSKTHRSLTAALAKETNAVVYVPDYRLAPEYAFPAGIDDCVASYQWLLDQGYSPEQIVVAGDSAGGCLTMATALRIKELGLPQPAGLVVLSPWVDLTLANRSLSSDSVDPLLRWSNLAAGAKSYLQGADPSDPLASPVFADLSGLPPLLIQVGTEEILLSDAQRLNVQAEASGIPTKLTAYKKAWHVFQLQAGIYAQADSAIEEIAVFINNARQNVEQAAA